MWTGKDAVYSNQSEESRRRSDTGRADLCSRRACLYDLSEFNVCYHLLRPALPDCAGDCSDH